jgi:hypothetical protein
MISRTLPNHRSRSDDFVCTPQPVSQVTVLQSYSILLFYSVTTCAILTNICATHIFLSKPSNVVSLTFHLSPAVAKASPHPKSRAFPLFDLSSLGVNARLLQAAVSITTPHFLTATSTSSLISSLSFNPSTNHSPSVTPYNSQRTLYTTQLRSLTT